MAALIDEPHALCSPKVVQGDRFCAKCGYNLRTLPREGVCPECGLAVETSLSATSLAGAERRWLIRVGLGLGMLVVASLLAVAAVTFNDDSGDVFALPLVIAPAGFRITLFVSRMGGFSTAQSALAISSLVINAAGVCAIAWPGDHRERGVIVAGRVLLCALAVLSIVLGAGGNRVLDGILWLRDLSWREELIVVLGFECAFALLAALAISAIAARTGVRRVIRWMRVAIVLQAGALLLLLGTILVHDTVLFHLLSIMLVGISGVAVMLIIAWLIVAVYAELLDRGRAARAQANG